MYRPLTSLLLVLLLILGCEQRPQQTIASTDSTSHPNAMPISNKTDSLAKRMEALETASRTQESELDDSLGQKISTITFKIKATGDDIKSADEGNVPWINLDSPKKKLNGLIDPDELVLPYKKVVLIIDYPVKKPVFFELSSSANGFSKKQIILEIYNRYHQMYDEEERTAKIKTIPTKQRKLLANRNQTDGKFGIWGHDLSDLELSSIDVFKNSRNIIFLRLDIES